MDPIDFIQILRNNLDRPTNRYPTRPIQASTPSTIPSLSSGAEGASNELAFREFGFKDFSGAFTQIAIDLVLQKIVKEHESYLLSLCK
jgi:hypothetical protein